MQDDVEEENELKQTKEITAKKLKRRKKEKVE